MSMRFHILGSSSSGNCTLLRTEQTSVLIDVGFSARRIETMLKTLGMSLADIDAVFITHEHGDHIAGMRGLSRQPHLRYFANRPTAEAVQRTLSREVAWRLFETGQTFKFQDLTIESVPLPHDAYDPVGYIFRSGGMDLFNPPRSLAWLTDLGYIPPTLPERLTDANVIVLEANHESDMLDQDMKRPFSVKQRIRGRHGHLSNDAAHAFLESASLPRLTRVYLAHLSKDCNCVQRVTKRFVNNGFPFSVEVVDPFGGPHAPFDLMECH